MDRRNNAYTKFALTSEMMETPGIIEKFDFKAASEAEKAVARRKKVFFTGEGSSRIFPAKQFLYQAMRVNAGLQAATDGSRQAIEYDLSDFAVFAASNSGKTKEVVQFLRGLKARGHGALFSLSAFADTPLGQASTAAYVLSCGKEQATAATKSVVEQALFYHAILDRMTGANRLPRGQRPAAGILKGDVAGHPSGPCQETGRRGRSTGRAATRAPPRNSRSRPTRSRASLRRTWKAPTPCTASRR